VAADEGGFSTRAMFAPGRLVHLTRREGDAAGRVAPGPPKVHAAWVPRAALAAGGAQALSARLLLPHALTDHFPWHILEALDAAIDAAKANAGDGV
jgi:hypothetical protein